MTDQAAVAEDEQDLLQIFLKEGKDFVPQGIFGLSPLLFDAFQGDANQIEKLLYEGVTGTQCDDGGNTALMWAARKGHVNVVKTLLKCNVDTDQQDPEGRTAFIWAARQGHIQVIQTLKEVKEIDHMDKHGRTPLMYAAFHGHLEPLVHLINNGSDVNHKDHDGWTSLMCASQQGHSSIVQYLILNNADIFAVNIVSQTSLAYAAIEGFLEVVRELVEFGANVNHADNLGYTPLVHAAKSGHLDVVVYLLQCGTKLLSIPKAMEVAVTEGHVDVVIKLTCHAKPNKARFSNVYGVSLVSWTVILDDLASLDALLEMKPSSMDVDEYGEVPIMDCARYNNLEALKRLLSSNKCVSYQNAKGQTAMDIALKENHSDIINILQSLDEAENGKGDGRTRSRAGRPFLSIIKQTDYLIAAAKRGHWRVIKVLLHKGVHLLKPDQQGRTALHYAITANKESVEVLLPHLNPNVQDEDGRTPLHLAVEAGKWEIASLLLKHGACNIYKQRMTPANLLFEQARRSPKAKGLLKTMILLHHVAILGQKTLETRIVCENEYISDLRELSETSAHEKEALLNIKKKSGEEMQMLLNTPVVQEETTLYQNETSLNQEETFVDRNKAVLSHIDESLQKQVDIKDTRKSSQNSSEGDYSYPFGNEPVYYQVIDDSSKPPTELTDPDNSIYSQVDTENSVGRDRNPLINSGFLSENHSKYSEDENQNAPTDSLVERVRDSDSALLGKGALLPTKNLRFLHNKNSSSVLLDNDLANSQVDSCREFNYVLQDPFENSSAQEINSTSFATMTENTKGFANDQGGTCGGEEDQDLSHLKDVDEKQDTSDMEENHKQDDASNRRGTSNRIRVNHVRFTETNEEDAYSDKHEEKDYKHCVNYLSNCLSCSAPDSTSTEDLCEDILQAEVSCHGHMQVNSCFRSLFGPTDNAQLMINFTKNPKVQEKSRTKLKLPVLVFSRQLLMFLFQCFILYYGHFIISLVLFFYHQNHNRNSNVSEFLATLTIIVLAVTMLMLYRAQIKDHCLQNLGSSYKATIIYRKAILGRTLAEMYPCATYRKVTVLLCGTQLLPAFISFHHIGLSNMLINYDCIKILCPGLYKELLSHYEHVGKNICAVNTFVALGLGFPQLLLVLSVIGPNENVPTPVILCIVLTALSVSVALVNLESNDKAPAKISLKGQLLLFVSFLLRFFPIAFCIAEFIRCFGAYILCIYAFHIILTLTLHYVAERQYGTKVFDPQEFFTFRKMLSICFNFFQFIPQKTYGHDHKTSYTKVLFLNMIVFEDLFMVSWVMGLGETVPLMGDHFLLFIIIMWFFSIIFLTAYYKYGHPWRWNIKFGKQLCRTIHG